MNTLAKKFQKALQLHQQGNLAQAQKLYEEINVAAPDNFQVVNMLALVALQGADYGKAIALYDKAITLNPNSAAAYFNRGHALQVLNQHESAVASYQQAIKLQPDYPEAYAQCGAIYRSCGDNQTAITYFDKAIACKPDFVTIHFNRGNALRDLKRFDDAVGSYDLAIALKPDYVEALLNRGNTLMELKRTDDAIDSFNAAIKYKPDYIEAYVNLGNALKDSGQLEAAVARYDEAIALAPNRADAWANRGNVLNSLNRQAAAIDSFDRAIALDPQLADAYWNKSLALLVSGDFEHGLPLYEWRWQIGAFAGGKKDVPQPLWTGNESLSGKTILLYSEQGFGDAIQFCRYAALVAARGARVILEVQPALSRLLKDLNGVDAIVSRGEPLPAFDYHCPLLSLPLAFDTRLDTIPASAGYLHVDSDIRARWAERLGPANKLRVGLVWSGSATHKNDHNRSLQLVSLLNALPDKFQYISLQKEIRDEDRQTLNRHPELLHLGDELQDFADTAALCDLMDIVISVDTSVAHLSGAVGTATWVLLPYSPDWRWLLERSDSPWYPAMTLYRQPASGDWTIPLKQINDDLLRTLT